MFPSASVSSYVHLFWSPVFSLSLCSSYFSPLSSRLSLHSLCLFFFSLRFLSVCPPARSPLSVFFFVCGLLWLFIKPKDGPCSCVRAPRSWGTNASVSLRKNRGQLRRRSWETWPKTVLVSCWIGPWSGDEKGDEQWFKRRRLYSWKWLFSTWPLHLCHLTIGSLINENQFLILPLEQLQFDRWIIVSFTKLSLVSRLFNLILNWLFNF